MMYPAIPAVSVAMRSMVIMVMVSLKFFGFLGEVSVGIVSFKHCSYYLW